MLHELQTQLRAEVAEHHTAKNAITQLAANIKKMAQKVHIAFSPGISPNYIRVTHVERTN